MSRDFFSLIPMIPMALLGAKPMHGYAAGRDVRAFLEAAREGDVAALATHIDRLMTIADLRTQLPATVSDKGVAAIAARLLQPASCSVIFVDAGPYA